MKKILLALVLINFTGCVSHPVFQDRMDKEYGWVKIYSTKDINIAQRKADFLCGHHAFYLKNEHEANVDIIKKDLYINNFANYIPFQCEVVAASRAGNAEAIQIVNKETQESYKKLDEAKRKQYEAHKAYAKKYGSDSYSVINPDGSIEAHSFDRNGNACHSSVSKNTSGSYCD